MSKPLSFYGQLNLTEINEALKSGHIKAQKIQTKKGEQIVFDVMVWVHEEADQFNNNASVQCSLKTESHQANVKNTYYIGNLRYQIPKVETATDSDIAEAITEDDDLPF